MAIPPKITTQTPLTPTVIKKQQLAINEFQKKSRRNSGVPYKTLLVIAIILIQTIAFAGWYTLTVWTKVPIKGSVVDSKGVAVKDAIVKSGSKITMSDEYGNYELLQIPYGATTVEITKAGYGNVSKDIELPLKKGASYNAVLPTIEYGQVKGNIVLDNALASSGGLTYEQLTVTLGSTTVPVDKNGYFESPRVAPGDIVLGISAPGLDPYSQVVTIKPGLNTLEEISLANDKSIVLTIKDWYTNEALTGARVTINNERYSTNKQGITELTGLNTELSTPLSIDAEGYATKNLTTNTLGNFEITLPQLNTLYSTSSQDGTSRIYSSNMDGSEQKALSKPGVEVTEMEVTVNDKSEIELLFTGYEPTGARDSVDQPISHVYKLNTASGEQVKIETLRGLAQTPDGLERSIPLLNSRHIVTLVQKTDRIQVLARPFQGENKEVLSLDRASNELINVADAIVSKDGSYLGLLKQQSTSGATQNSIRLISLKDNQVDKNIVFAPDEGLTIQGMVGFSADNSQLLFETKDGTGVQILQILDIKNFKSKEVKNLELDRYKAKTKNNSLYYLSGTKLIALELSTLEKKEVVAGFTINNFGFYKGDGLLIESAGKLWFYDEKKTGKPALSQAITNFNFIK
jgi:hypothetical protein